MVVHHKYAENVYDVTQVQKCVECESSAKISVWYTFYFCQVTSLVGYICVERPKYCTKECRQFISMLDDIGVEHNDSKCETGQLKHL
jgi:hypothetical protein